MKTRTLLSTCCASLTAAAALLVLNSVQPLRAQTDTETKIRLMADALRARDAGELELARQTAQRLLERVPNDPRVLQLLRELDTLIAAREEAIRNPKPPPMQDVKIPEPPEAAKEGAKAGASAAQDVEVDLPTEADSIIKAESERIAGLLAQVPAQRQRARKLATVGRYDEALKLLQTTSTELPLNPMTKEALDRIAQDRREIEAKRAADTSKSKANGGRTKTSRAETGEAGDGSVAPESTATAEATRLVEIGRSQYLAGDLEAAAGTFRAVEAADPENVAAKTFLVRIARDRSDAGELNREKTRAQLIEEVTKSWQRPGVLQPPARADEGLASSAPLARKLEEIVLPAVSFTRTEIGQVVAALSAMAEEYDHTDPPKGVNIVLLDPANKKPTVSLTLHNASLRRVLDFVAASIGYQYEMQPDAVVLRPEGETSVLDTEFFPVARATVLRMTGAGATPGLGVIADGRLAGGVNHEAKPATATGEGAAIQGFLQQAGVSFGAVPGASLAYDGSALIVTQTTRNLQRIRAILDRYNDVRQVEIEAKFIEVQEGALEELGVNWTVSQKATQHGGARATYRTSGRSLASAFGSSNGNQQGRIVRPEGVTAGDDGEVIVSEPLDIPIINNAPRIPGSAELASAAGSLASVTGIIGEFDVNAVVRALSQKQGTDLLSAPKVTVLSGNPATITVAQEMRYPQSFGQTQSQVGTGNASGGGSAGVAITAGTPQEFTKRNVGVELRVIPTVEEDDYSISLELNPKVTEFDGFVEYGGPSIAISGSTTVTVPSGFYQPIFSVRDISTKVTIWDGATLVMGGLTREEVKKVNDKVPLLGDLPLIGRAFRSQGESAQKRNLLIFVTANLVNPGGALKKPTRQRVSANSIYQNPTVVTPGSAAPRRQP